MQLYLYPRWAFYGFWYSHYSLRIADTWCLRPCCLGHPQSKKKELAVTQVSQTSHSLSLCQFKAGWLTLHDWQSPRNQICGRPYRSRRLAKLQQASSSTSRELESPQSGPVLAFFVGSSLLTTQTQVMNAYPKISRRNLSPTQLKTSIQLENVQVPIREAGRIVRSLSALVST